MDLDSTYHISTEPGRCHGGKVRCSSVVFAATNDCDSSELACLQCQLLCCQSIHPLILPLWNFSSMGGTILYTFDNSSLRVSFEAMIDRLSVYVANRSGESNCKCSMGFTRKSIGEWKWKWFSFSPPASSRQQRAR